MPWLALALSFLLLLPAPAAAQARVSLVVGMNVYDSPDIPPLSNALNDAGAMHDKLQRLGFDSVLLENPTRDGLRRGLTGLFNRRRALGAEVALVFFAGHGVQWNNEGYLLARNSALAQGANLEANQEIPVTRLLEVVAEAKLAILLLDACRNTPAFSARLALRSRNSISAGLPLVSQLGSAVISFAAEPRASAADGNGANSPYTEALLEYMGRSGLELGPMLHLVRRYVEQSTQQAQSPVFEDRRQPGSLFYFARPSDPVRAAPALVAPSRPGGRDAVASVAALSAREALNALGSARGAERGDRLAHLLRDPGLSGPLPVDTALTLLGDVPTDGGRRRVLLSRMLSLLDIPIGPTLAERLLAGLGESARYAALLDMLGCLARPLSDAAARRLVEGIERQHMPSLLRQLSSPGDPSSTCGRPDG